MTPARDQARAKIEFQATANDIVSFGGRIDPRAQDLARQGDYVQAMIWLKPEGARLVGGRRSLLEKAQQGLDDVSFSITKTVFGEDDYLGKAKYVKYGLVGLASLTLALIAYKLYTRRNL